MRMARFLVSSVALLLAAVQAPAAAPPSAPAVPEKISYYRAIRPILQQHCQGCHQPAKAGGGYVMITHADLLKKGDSDEPGIVPGKPEQSRLLEMILPQEGEPPQMPRGQKPLLAGQVQMIRQWIIEGARDDSPASARVVVDADHPPAYRAPPVITALDYSPDGSLLAVSGYHEVLLHKADGSGLVGRLVGLSERIQAAAFSPDGKFLAVAGGAPARFGEVQIWDLAKRTLKQSVSVTFDTVYGVRWSPDGSKVSFGCADNTVRVIDAKTGKEVLYQGAHSDWVLDTVFSRDGSHLISVSRDMSMKLTDVATQRFEDNITSITPGALKGGLMTVDRHPTRDEVLIGGSDGEPKIYRIYRPKNKPRQIGDDFNKIIVLPAFPGRIFAARFNADGSRLVVGSSNDGRGVARIYEYQPGDEKAKKAPAIKLIAVLEKPKGAVYAVAFRRDGKQVATAGFDGTVLLHDAQTGKLIKEFVPVPLPPAHGKENETKFEPI